MAGSATDLERIQRWFHTAITHPGGGLQGLQSERATRILPEANHAIENIVLPSNALNSTERLSIYANMYFDRLIDILADEFPSVRQLLGPETFAGVVKDYVTQHPSTHYSLAQLGREFPQFLLEDSDGSALPNREFAAAVATVERTMEDVFDEQQVEPLSFEELQAIDQESWGQIRLRTIPALRLLKLPYPVNDFISAVRDQRSIDIPAANRSFVVVYRLNYRVWRRDINERQFTLLSGLQAGRTLGEALIACAELPGSDVATLAASVNDWFRDWAGEGFFHRVAVA